MSQKDRSESKIDDFEKIKNLAVIEKSFKIQLFVSVICTSFIKIYLDTQALP